LWQWQSEQWAGAALRTDGNGIAELGPVLFHGIGCLAIMAEAYRPAFISIDPLSAVDGRIRLRVELEAAHDSWELDVSDADGRPIAGADLSVVPILGSAPPVRIGATGMDGRLLVRGMWMFEGYRWRVSGSAYPWQCEARQWVVNSSGVREVAIVVPRRAKGRFVMDGRVEGDLSWKVLDPERGDGRGSILSPAMMEERDGNEVAATLPARWPIMVECLADSRTVFKRHIEVEADGWQVDATLVPDGVTRRIQLFSASSPIQSVRLGERSLFHASVEGAALKGQHAVVAPHSVVVNVECDPTSVAVLLADGSEFGIFGRRGEQDATIKLPHTDTTASSFAVRTESGEPVVDVVVRLLCLEATNQMQTRSPDWTLMRANNLYRLEVDADGCARRTLPVGRYEVKLEHLRDRVGVAQAWSPRGAQTVDVRPGGHTIVIETARPRLITVELEGGAVPGMWQLLLGPYSSDYGGRSCRVWLDGESHELRVLDWRDRELGRAWLPAGTDSTTVRVAVKAFEGQAGAGEGGR
jgi:hypothetical protein